MYFVQTPKLHLASWSVRVDETNEPSCRLLIRCDKGGRQRGKTIFGGTYFVSSFDFDEASATASQEIILGHGGRRIVCI